jgi:hypothetical protein
LRLGIRCWIMGVAAPTASLGPSVRTRTLVAETRRKRAARGRGVGCGVCASATASGNSSAGREPLAVPRTLGIWRVMRRLGGVTLGLPLSDTRLLGHAAARISCSKNLDSKDYSATGQRGVDGERAVASATTSILHKAPNEKNAPHPTKHRHRSVHTHAAHTGPSRPKRITRLKRHGKVFNFRSGRKGSAARLTVGLVRGSNVGGPGAKWRTRASASHLHRRPRRLTRGPSTRAMAHCKLISRSIWKHGDRFRGQVCCKQHASPTRLWEDSEEAHPPCQCCESHHSLRCHLTRPGRCRMPRCLQRGPTRAIAPSFCALLCVEGRACV